MLERKSTESEFLKSLALYSKVPEHGEVSTVKQNDKNTFVYTYSPLGTKRGNPYIKDGYEVAKTYADALLAAGDGGVFYFRLMSNIQIEWYGTFGVLKSGLIKIGVMVATRELND